MWRVCRCVAGGGLEKIGVGKPFRKVSEQCGQFPFIGDVESFSPDYEPLASEHTPQGDFSRVYMENLLVPNRFLPNTPTWTGSGVGKGQLAACFVLPIEDTMESIFGTLRDAALIQSTGGGTGFTFGHLRPSGATVKSSQGISSGAVSFIGAYDAVFNAVQQGG